MRPQLLLLSVTPPVQVPRHIGGASEGLPTKENLPTSRRRANSRLAYCPAHVLETGRNGPQEKDGYFQSTTATATAAADTRRLGSVPASRFLPPPTSSLIPPYPAYAAPIA